MTGIATTPIGDDSLMLGGSIMNFLAIGLGFVTRIVYIEQSKWYMGLSRRETDLTTHKIDAELYHKEAKCRWFTGIIYWIICVVTIVVGFYAGATSESALPKICGYVIGGWAVLGLLLDVGMMAYQIFVSFEEYNIGYATTVGVWKNINKVYYEWKKDVQPEKPNLPKHPESSPPAKSSRRTIERLQGAAIEMSESSKREAQPNNKSHVARKPKPNSAHKHQRPPSSCAAAGRRKFDRRSRTLTNPKRYTNDRQSSSSEIQFLD